MLSPAVPSPAHECLPEHIGPHTLDEECTICNDRTLKAALDDNHPHNGGLGSLDCCEHLFCHCCIQKWVTECSNTCPLCKREAHKLVRRRRKPFGRLPNGERNHIIEADERTLEQQEARGRLDELTAEELERLEAEEEAQGNCVQCGNGENDHLILLCDSCNSGYHSYCVGLGHSVPDGDWYCPVCAIVHQPEQQQQLQRQQQQRQQQQPAPALRQQELPRWIVEEERRRGGGGVFSRRTVVEDDDDEDDDDEEESGDEEEERSGEEKEEDEEGDTDLDEEEEEDEVKPLADRIKERKDRMQAEEELFERPLAERLAARQRMERQGSSQSSKSNSSSQRSRIKPPSIPPTRNNANNSAASSASRVSSRSAGQTSNASSNLAYVVEIRDHKGERYERSSEYYVRYSDHHGLASGEPKWEPGHLVERTEGLAGLIVSFWAAKGDPKAKGELPPPPPPPRQAARPSSQGSDSGWRRSVGSQKRELEQKREQREKRQHVERANFSRFFTSQGSELDSQAMVQQLGSQAAFPSASSQRSEVIDLAQEEEEETEEQPRRRNNNNKENVIAEKKRSKAAAVKEEKKKKPNKKLKRNVVEDSESEDDTEDDDDDVFQ